MPAFDRRRFLERLGLAATAPLLHGIAGGLLSTALGAPSSRRCFVVVVVGETWHMKGALTPVPPDVDQGKVNTDKYGVGEFGPVDAAGVTIPSYFKPLEAFKSRLSIVDGLQFEVGKDTQHGAGFALLTGLPTDGASPEYGGGPTGPSLDQYLAKQIGRDTPNGSLLFGFQGESAADQSATTFAAGSRQGLSHLGKPSLLYARLMGQKATASTPGGAGNEALLRKKLIESMRADVKRLQAELAGEEKVRLDQHLAAIDEYDRQQEKLRELQASVNCGMPPAPAEGSPEKRLASMFDMATLALKCGLTNVVGVSVGHGFGHDDLKLMREWLPTSYGAHGPEDVYGPAMNKVNQQLSGLVAGMLNGLGPVADNTTVLMLPGSGTNVATHHSLTSRWAALLFDGPGALKPGPHYVRYAPKRTNVVHLFRTVAHAMGVTSNDFASGSPMAADGPLPELLR